MATLNLGRIKPVFRGAYAGGTAYVVDDIVTSGGETFICILASTGNATSNATYWTKLAQKGTDGTDVGATLTTQGDILYRDGSGLQRLGAGTNGQALLTGGAGANPSWGTISSGEYSINKIDFYNYATNTTCSGETDYHDIAGGNYLSFTPTSVNDYVHFMGTNTVYDGSSSSGASIYTMMSTSTSIGSGDTKIGYNGTHANYCGGTNDFYRTLQHNYLMKCTGLTVDTAYYVELACATHGSGNSSVMNYGINNANSDGRNRFHLIHYKKN